MFKNESIDNINILDPEFRDNPETSNQFTRLAIICTLFCILEPKLFKTVCHF